MSALPPTSNTAEIEQQVERVLRSRVFAKAHRSQRFLRYLVDVAGSDPARIVKEYTLALEVFDRDTSYDPAVDATVRVEASRLRGRLRDYFAEEGKNDPILIQVPKGSYCITFTSRQVSMPASPSTSPNHSQEPELNPVPVVEQTQPSTDLPSARRSLWRAFRFVPRSLLPFAALGIAVLVLLVRGRAPEPVSGLPKAPAIAPRVSAPSVAASPAVLQACARGRNYFDKREANASEQAFRQAIDLDPAYAPAYTGLANALASEVLMEDAPVEVNVPRAIAAAQRALQLDPASGDAWIARGSIELAFLWRWEAARADLQHGLQLSPRSSFGYMQMAIYNDAQGNVEEAVADMRRAVELDPLSFFMARHYGSALFYARRYNEALAQLQYARSMHPQSQAVVDGWIRGIYWLEGKRDAAVHYDLLPLEQTQGRTSAMHFLTLYRRHGATAYWSARAMRLQDTTGDACFPYERGFLLLLAGRSQEGLRNLGEAANRHCYWTTMLPVEPVLDPYRSEPAYAAIIQKLHLSPKASFDTNDLPSSLQP